MSFKAGPAQNWQSRSALITNSNALTSEITDEVQGVVPQKAAQKRKNVEETERNNRNNHDKGGEKKEIKRHK